MPQTRPKPIDEEPATAPMPAPVVPASPAPAKKLDETEQGGRFFNAAGKLVNAEGQRIHEDGSRLSPDELAAEVSA